MRATVATHTCKLSFLAVAITRGTNGSGCSGTRWHCDTNGENGSEGKNWRSEAGKENERKSFGGNIFSQQDLDENEMKHMQVDILRLKSISSSF
jgi:hypothetical protein